MASFTPVGVRVATIAFVSTLLGCIALGYHYFRGSSWPLIGGTFGPLLWILLFSNQPKNVTAGSDWIRVNAKWVCTNKLERVRIYGTSADSKIELRDRDERRIKCRLSELTASPAVWALFRTALTTSMATGLDPDERTRVALELGASRDRAHTL